MTFSLGVGLTNACNLACEHCYRALGTEAAAQQRHPERRKGRVRDPDHQERDAPDARQGEKWQE